MAKVGAMKEAIRYLNNAKELLAKSPIEDNEYTDVKPVREAFWTMYLAILEAINDTLHIAGYYRGLICNTVMVKDAFKMSKEFIEKFKLSSRLN